MTMHPKLTVMPLASHKSSPHNYLYADLFAISYTALDASYSYLVPSSPPLHSPARYYDPGNHNCNTAGRGASFTKCAKTLKLAIGSGVPAAALALLTFIVYIKKLPTAHA